MISMLVTGAAMVACSDDDEVRTPVASVNVDHLSLHINESMSVTFDGVADQVVIYTGDEDHDYELRDEGNTGVVVNKNHFTYAYSNPGKFKAVCVASCYGDLGADLVTDTCSFFVEVIDNHTEILRLSCPQVLYDEVFAEDMGDGKWLMRLPRKVVYNGREVAQTLNQRLKFYLGSQLSDVAVDGEPYATASRYNLATPKSLRVTADSGDYQDYTLYGINYPEFKSVTFNGLAGTVKRDAFNYREFTCTIQSNGNFDSDNVTMVYTMTGEGDEVYLDGRKIESGSSGLSIADGTVLRLVSTVENEPSLKAEVYLTVKID